MINKIIACILIVLILINGIGCYSYNQIKKNDPEKLEEYDEVKITTWDEKEYILSDVEIQDLILMGHRHKYKYVYRSYGKETEIEEVVIPTQQIYKIEVDKIDTGLTVLTVVLVIAIPFAAFVIMISQIEK